MAVSLTNLIDVWLKTNFPFYISSSHNSRSTSPTGGARRSDDMESINDADDLAQEIMEDLNCVVCQYVDAIW